MFHWTEAVQEIKRLKSGYNNRKEGKALMKKIQIEELPITEEFLPRKRLLQDRGELALIEDGGMFRHLGYFSLKKGRGYYRGGHYHLNKVEHFYVVSGKIMIDLVDLETGEKGRVTVRTGNCVTLEPNCAHRFEAVEDTQVIEYYATTYDVADDLFYEDF